MISTKLHLNDHEFYVSGKCQSPETVTRWRAEVQFDSQVKKACLQWVITSLTCNWSTSECLCSPSWSCFTESELLFLWQRRRKTSLTTHSHVRRAGRHYSEVFQPWGYYVTLFYIFLSLFLMSKWDLFLWRWSPSFSVWSDRLDSVCSVSVRVRPPALPLSSVQVQQTKVRQTHLHL